MARKQMAFGGPRGRDTRVRQREGATAVKHKSTTRGPLLEAIYRRFLKDEDTAGFIKAVSQRYAIPTLERLALAGRTQARRAALLSLGFISDHASTPAVAVALHDKDKAVRLIADNAIRTLWCRQGTEPQRKALAMVMRMNGTKRFHEAIRRATDLVRENPDIAEAWNQRAISHFQLHEFDESIGDCHATLERNPFHFGAASGMGQSYLELGYLQPALSSFERALEINPGLDSVRRNVERLRAVLEE